MMLQLYVFSSLSLLAKLTSMLNEPADVGVMFNINVVLAPGATLLAGCWTTVAMQFTELLSRAWPLMLSVVPPVFRIK